MNKEDFQILDLASIPPNSLILTPNRRLSAWLIQDHNALMVASGQTTWPRLKATPLEHWLLDLHLQICLLVQNAAGAWPELISARQSAVIWRSVIEQDDSVQFDVDGLIQLSQQARALVSRWRWRESQWSSGEKLEQQQFARWHCQYLQKLESGNLIDSAALPEFIMDNGSALKNSIQGPVWFYGFNDQSEPQLLELIQWLKLSGIGADLASPAQRNGQCRVHTFDKLDDQFGAAIQWALAREKPTDRVGIVVPNLQQRRLDIRSLCQAAWLQQPGAEARHWSDAINITAGQPLTDYPQIEHLLLLLRGLNQPLSLLEWKVLLSSPYFPNNVSEWMAREAFIQRLREKNIKQLSLTSLLFHAKPQHRLLTLNLDWLESLQHSTGNIRKQTLSQWLLWLTQFIQTSQWARARTQSSEEFQVHQRATGSFRELLEIDSYLGAVSIDQFRTELMELLKSVQFQPQTDTAPIQIMGVLEAAGLQFDKIWVCECESVNWPQTLSPNALLSRREQRLLNMPGASPERELQYAENLLTGFAQSAGQVIFSWGSLQGDTDHTLAPLLQHIPLLEETAQHTKLVSLERLQFHSGHDQVEVLPPDETGAIVADQHAKGGSGLIRSQSLCPFKAFAEYRLFLRSQDELVDGIKASDRGSLVHQVLEAFWREIKNFDALQHLLKEEQLLDSTLEAIIAHQMIAFRQSVVLEPEALYQLEQERTFNLVKRWLTEHELLRQPFEVAQIEKRKVLQIGGIELSLTVDRIDQLADGRLLVIDYKTGIKDGKAWQGDRPEEPQLPLYALLEPDATGGIVFGILHNNKMGYKGLAENRNNITDAKTRGIDTVSDWPAQLHDWRTVLNSLAQQYINGYAAVDPLTPSTCQYCHLQPLCRIKEIPNDAG